MKNYIKDFFKYHKNLWYKNEEVNSFLKLKDKEIQEVNAIISEILSDDLSYYYLYLFGSIYTEEKPPLLEIDIKYYTYQYIENNISELLGLDTNDLFVIKKDNKYYFSFTHMKEKEEIKTFILNKIQKLIENGDMFVVNTDKLFDQWLFKFLIDNLI